jgi:hypothetical protein
MLTEGRFGIIAGVVTSVVTGVILVIAIDLRTCALTEIGLRICILIAIVVD